MSAIDSLVHVHVSDLLDKVCVYWPQESVPLDYVINTEDSKNKMLTQEHLLAGGGSGEHPALLIFNDAVVLQALVLDSFVNEPEQIDNIEEKAKEFFMLKNKVYETYYLNCRNPDFAAIRAYWNINKNHWPIDTFCYFMKAFKEDGFLINDETEVILKDLFAAFIIEKMPLDCLMDNAIKELVLKYIECKEALKPYSKEAYKQKLLSYFEKPHGDEIYGKNYPVDGKTQWGYSLDMWKEERNKI